MRGIAGRGINRHDRHPGHHGSPAVHHHPTGVHQRHTQEPAMSSIGEKVAHVRRAANTGDHHCHWPGCTKRVKPALWGCRDHWFTLPDGIRRRIWAAYRAGQEDSKTPSRSYVEVAREAQEWIREHRPETRSIPVEMELDL